jgi:hypothetical protein
MNLLSLEEEAEAFRLIVMSGMDVCYTGNWVFISRGDDEPAVVLPINNNPHRATREAIIKASKLLQPLWG